MTNPIDKSTAIVALPAVSGGRLKDDEIAAIIAYMKVLAGIDPSGGLGGAEGDDDSADGDDDSADAGVPDQSDHGDDDSAEAGVTDGG